MTFGCRCKQAPNKIGWEIARRGHATPVIVNWFSRPTQLTRVRQSIRRSGSASSKNELSLNEILNVEQDFATTAASQETRPPPIIAVQFYGGSMVTSEMIGEIYVWLFIEDYINILGPVYTMRLLPKALFQSNPNPWSFKLVERLSPHFKPFLNICPRMHQSADASEVTWSAAARWLAIGIQHSWICPQNSCMLHLRWTNLDFVVGRRIMFYARLHDTTFDPKHFWAKIQ